MSYKKITGLGVLSIGAVLTMLAIHSMQKTHEAKQNVAITSDVLKKNVGQNDTGQIFLLVGGMSLLIGGGGSLLYFRIKDEK